MQVIQMAFILAPPLFLLHVPLNLKLPHLLAILLDLQPSLTSRSLNLRGKTLIGSHAHLATTERVLDPTNTLGVKIRVVEERGHRRERSVPLPVQIQNEMVLHINVPGSPPACSVLNDRLSSLIICEVLDRQRGRILKVLGQIHQPISLSSRI